MSTPIKKPLGVWMLSSLVVGNIIGSGIFLIPSTLAGYGSISLLSWVITLVGSLCLAYVFSDLNKILPQTGGPFLYTRAAFGNFLGFIVAYTYWIAWCVANATMVLAIPGYLSVFFPILKSSPYASLMQFLIEAAIVWIIVAINLCGIKAVGRTQLITTILKVVPLLIIGFAGLPYIHLSYLTTNFVSPTMSGTQALLGAMTVTLWAFTGFESATIPADDATHVRHIKQATIWGTLFVGLLYILCSFTLLGLIPGDQLKQSISPFADATTLLFGATAAKLIAVCACISIIGSLNGCILVQALDSVAAARFNLGPKSFTYLKKNNVAHLAFIWSGIAITLLLALSLHKTLIEQFNFIILISTLAFLIPYFICCMAAFILHLKKDTGLSYKNRPKAFLITVFASIYSFCTMIGAGKDIVFYGSLFFFSAFPLYVVLFWKKKELQEAE